MAQQQILTVLDDFDGSEGAEAFLFGLDGEQYSIDLTPENAGRIRDFLTPYVDAATKVQTPRGSRAKAKASASNPEAPKIRAWAQEQGLQVGARGRIDSEIVAAYHAAQAAPAEG